MMRVVIGTGEAGVTIELKEARLKEGSNSPSFRFRRSSLHLASSSSTSRLISACLLAFAASCEATVTVIDVTTVAFLGGVVPKCSSTRPSC